MGFFDKWNKSKFNVFESEEKTVLRLLENIGNFIGEMSKGLDNKTEVNGDHKGSWQGLNKPTLSEEGMRATVEKLDTDVENIKNELETTAKTIIDLSNPPNQLVGENTTSTFQNIINYLKTLGGGAIFIPTGNYEIDTVTLCDNLYIFGGGTIIKTINGTNKAIFFGKNIKNVFINGLTFNYSSANNNSPFIRFESVDINTKVQNITIKNCYFEDIINFKSSLVVIYGYYENVKVESCRFKGNSKTYLLLFDHNTYYQSYDSQSYVINNEFDGGNGGFATQGSGAGTGTIFVIDNSFKNHNSCALNLYHVNGFVVRGNEIRDCSQVPFSNCDSGNVFLDLVNPTEIHKQSIFEGNTIYNCVGNAIYCEELQNTLIQNNIIKNISLRSTDYTLQFTYTDITSTHSSKGGKGILLTGGCIDNIIQNNTIINCASYCIELNRVIGVQQWYNITNNKIMNNFLTSDVRCIGLMEKTDDTTIKGNIMKITDLTKTTGYGVYIGRINENTNNTTNYVYIHDNHIKAYNGIYKTYGYNRICCANNVIEKHASGSAISVANNQGYVSNNISIVDNVIQS